MSCHVCDAYTSNPGLWIVEDQEKQHLNTNSDGSPCGHQYHVVYPNSSHRQKLSLTFSDITSPGLTCQATSRARLEMALPAMPASTAAYTAQTMLQWQGAFNTCER